MMATAAAPENTGQAGRLRVLESVLESMAEGAIAADAQGQFFLFNAAAQRILRMGIVQGGPQDWSRLYGCYLPDTLTPYAAEQLPLVRAMRGEAVDEAELFLRHAGAPEGVWLAVSARPLRGPGGEPAGGLIVFRDITARRHAEQQIVFQASLLDQARNAVVATDRLGRILYWNRHAELLHGWKREEALGHEIVGIAVPAANAKEYAEAVAWIEANGSCECEVTCQRQDGSTFPAYVTAAPVERDGAVAGFVYVTVDISERKRAEEELSRSHEQLRRLTARLESIREVERTRMAREIHDQLGQNLTALNIELSHIARRLAEDPELAAQARTAADLVNSTISTVQRIATELRPSILDDLGLAAAIEWQAREFQARTRIRCVLARGAEVGAGRNLATAVFRIFQEILTNIARHAGATAVVATLTERGGWLTLEVKDDGRGITEEQIADPKSLGLLGMRERARAFGGDVKITGVAGEGTTITLRVPCRRERRRRATP